MFVGQYEIISELGVGGMGSVKLGRSPEGRTVVLKIPHSGDASFRELLLDEARVGLRLKHPHIVETLDFFELEGKPVLVLAYVSGACLGDLREGGPLPVPMVVRIGRQISEALHAVHQATDENGRPLHMVHRDVTPGNIMIGHDGDARLIDMGITKSDDNQAAKTKTGYIRGTLRYLAPEIFADGVYSAQSDIWALAVGLLDAALGTHAIAGSEGEIVAKVLGGNVLSSMDLSSLDKKFVRAMRKLLNNDPKARPERANDAAALFAFLEKEYGASQADSAREVEARIGPAAEPAAETDEATELVVKQATATFCASEESVDTAAPTEQMVDGSAPTAQMDDGSGDYDDDEETVDDVPAQSEPDDETVLEAEAGDYLSAYASGLRQMEEDAATELVAQPKPATAATGPVRERLKTDGSRSARTDLESLAPLGLADRIVQTVRENPIPFAAAAGALLLVLFIAVFSGESDDVKKSKAAESPPVAVADEPVSDTNEVAAAKAPVAAAIDSKPEAAVGASSANNDDPSLDELRKKMPKCWAPGRTRYFYYRDRTGSTVATPRYADVPKRMRKRVRCAE